MRLLLCSDVASEGLNLHYCCHRLMHFDLPWSLMVFQQRNGRVDRYGQAQEPQILYLFTATQVEQIRGDLRILEILQQKDEQAIEQARQARAEDETWPQLHYLWPQHPIVDWLVDRVITLFGRHRAPVIKSHSLQPGTQAFVMMGLVPNRKGQPLLVDWQVACRQPGQPFRLEPYDAFMQRAGLQAGQLPNPGLTSSLSDLQVALPEAVAHMRQHMVQRQSAFAGEMQQRLQGTLADLERLQDEQVQQLELRLEKQLEQVRRSQFERRSRVIRRVFDKYRQWVEETLSTEPEPYLQVLAAVCG